MRAALTFLVLILAGCSGGGGSSGGGSAGGTSGNTGNTGNSSSPFTLLSAGALSETQLGLRFSHPVDAESATRPDHYSIAGLGVFGAALDPTDPQQVVVETHYQGAQSWTVQFGAILDSQGRTLSTASSSFLGGGTPALERTDLQPPASLGDLQTRGWLVVDDPAANTSGPSAWTVQAGALRQTSNIYGGSSASTPEPDRPGSYFVYGAASFADGYLEARMHNGDDDAFGLLLRYADHDNHYRFEWDRQRRRQRLVKVVAGVAMELCFDTTRFELGVDYTVGFSVVADRLTAFVDGELVLSVRDTGLASGQAGIFCWGSDDLSAAEIILRQVGGPPPPRQGPVWRARPDAPLASHAPAVSEVGEDRAMLWVRSSEPAEVVFEVATEPSFRAGLASVPQTADVSSGLTAQADMLGLQPETDYYYRALLRDPADPQRVNPSRVGRFRTAPRASDSRDVVFAFSADFHQGVPDRFSMLPVISAQQPEFFLNLGDFSYQDSSPVSVTLEQYRARLQHLRSFDRIEDLFLDVPTFSTWDDHEVLNNWDGGTSAARVTAGTTSWKEIFPVRAAPGAGAGIYRRIRWGAAAELFMLDTRSFRPDNGVADNASKSMLGSSQKQWLLNGLASSNATFKIIISSVPLRYGTTGSDHWAGYTTERSEIFSYINNQGISGVFFLSGDQHWCAVHHHQEGFVEIQACPISAGLRSLPNPLDPHVVFAQEAHSFGVVRIDAAIGTAAVEIRDATGLLLHTEHLP